MRDKLYLEEFPANCHKELEGNPSVSSNHEGLHQSQKEVAGLRLLQCETTI